MELNQWLEQELSQDIWNNKYKHEGETLDAWFDRVSNGNAEVRQSIKDKKFYFSFSIPFILNFIFP